MANRSFAPDGLSLPDPFPVPLAWRGEGGAALFSPCGRYRWWLQRHWCAKGSAVVFVGLNPSTADGHRDDPTLRRLCGQARHWGHGRLLVLNLFSRVGRDPALLSICSEPVGKHSEAWLITALQWLRNQPTGPGAPPKRIWLGWGQQGALHGRDRRVRDLLRCWDGELVCVGMTRGGQPRHPLYVRVGLTPLPFVDCPPPCPGSLADTPSTCS